MSVSRLARTAFALFLGALAPLAAAAPASAHAYLAASAPADGAVLDRAPEVLTLTFTERVEASAARVDLVDGDGRHWAVTSLAVRPAGEAGAPGTAEAGTESPVILVAGLPALPPNVYHVGWRTLSSDDLHTTSGTLVFGVGRAVGPAAGPAGPAGPGPRETAARAVGLVGLAVLLGGAGLALITLITGRRRTGRAAAAADAADAAVGGAVAGGAVAGGGAAGGAGLRRRLLGTAAYGGAAALVATPIQLVVQVGGGDPVRRSVLLEQLTAGRWLLRELGLAVLLAVVLGVRRRGVPAGTGARAAVAGLGAAGALAAATGTALLGHQGGGRTLTLLAGTAHVLAAGGWAGAVLVAAAALLPLSGTGRRQDIPVRAVLHAFAVLAVTCLTVLTITGLLLTGAEVSTVDALLTSPYGLLLVAKVAAVGVAGLLGLRTARRLRVTGPGDAALPRRGLAAEAAVLAGVLVLAGALAAAGPARGPRYAVAGPSRTVPEVSGQAADLVDTVAIRPNLPGRNVVTITVNDTRRPAPARVTGVSVQLTAPDGTTRLHPVTRTADGWTVPVDDIRAAGAWRVAVTVLREGLPPVTDPHSWIVPAAPSAAAPVRVSAAPLRPGVDLLAVLAALVGAGVAAGWLRRRAAAGRPGPRTGPDRSAGRTPRATRSAWGYSSAGPGGAAGRPGRAGPG
ncbi:copper resistance CopC family protein [Plantactinospora siamensis]|uniref:Copper resistance CopC family protein n=1 Tax=Plantactinospora siamensis TaxID=555372 RepID=A0ABV6P0B9_9ACTN